MARGVPHDNETRAAVLAALLTGQSVHEVARTHHLSPSTVRAWRATYGPHAERFSAKEQEEIALLLLAYLVASLRTLCAQVQLFRDKEWLSRQRAADLAVLHGVLADKAFWLLEALQTDDASGRGVASSPGFTPKKHARARARDEGAA